MFLNYFWTMEEYFQTLPGSLSGYVFSDFHDFLGKCPRTFPELFPVVEGSRGSGGSALGELLI